MALNDKKFFEKIKILATAAGALSYIKPMDKTLRHKYINYNKTNPAIYALWHGSLYGFLSFRGEDRDRINLLISPSNDGEMITLVSKGIGFSIIRGSFKRRASRAIRELIKKLKEKQSVTFTVDGPRGPAKEVKLAVIKLAQVTGAPIIPMCPFSEHRFKFRSWDEFKLPFFFAKILTIFDEPIYIPRDATEEELEQYRIDLQDKLLKLEKKGKELVNKWHEL